MTAYYKAKLNKGGKEESNRKKQKQDASPGRSDNQAKSRGAKALCLSSLPGPIATPLLRVPFLLWGTGWQEDGEQSGSMEKLSEEDKQELA